MRKKTGYITLLILFFFQTSFSAFFNPLSIHAEELGSDSVKQTEGTTGAEITENIMTNVIMKDKNGDIIDINQNPDNHPSLGSAVEIEYAYQLENNHSYHAGSTFTFQLPEIFKVYNDVEDEKLTFGPIDIGTFTVKTDGTVTMTFNEEIEKRSNIKGNLKLWTEFTTDWKGSVQQDIVFSFTDDHFITIPVQFQPKPGSEIDKTGTPDKTYNATTINWTVDFNKQLKTIKNAVLRDPIQDGQQLQADSIHVYKLDVQLDGSVEQGDLVDPSEYVIEKTDTGEDFQLRFTSEEIDSAYRVTFTTDITDEDGKSYLNEATLIGDDMEQSAGASVSVSRGTPLSKKSTKYDSKTQTITWEIQYNYNEKQLSKDQAKLTDLFNDSQELIDGTFKVYQVTIDENGDAKDPVEFHNYTVTPTSTTEKNGFELQFNEAIDAAYKIVYQTKTIDRVFGNEKITNSVTSEEGINANGSRWIYQQILTKTNDSKYPNTNYETKTTTWKISFNKDEYSMKNVILSDEFTNKGLTFLPETLTIKSASGEQLEEGTDYTLTVNADGNGFQITFLKEISVQYNIEYETTFNSEARENTNQAFKNKVMMNWTDEFGDAQQKEATAQFKPDQYTKNNGYKNGSYNAITKEITWEVGINYNLKNIDQAKVIDYIEGNQTFVEGSIQVFEMNLTGSANGVEKGDERIRNEDFTIKEVEDEEGNPGFEIHFKNPIDTAYLITYKTSLQDQLIQKEYSNTALLFDGSEPLTSLNATVSVSHGGEYTDKTGTQNGKVIDWTVDINFGQSKVSNAILYDEPSTNQILLENSFHLYGTNISENGNVTKDDENELQRGKDYTLDINTDEEGKQTFELKFLNDIDAAYILEYQSYINAQDGDEVTNKTVFEGEQITTEKTESNEKIIVKLTGGSGTGSGETGNLEVTKVDATTKDVLKGATFTLYDKDGEIAIRTLTTGEDGKVIFKNLLYNDYLLKEESAPESYVVGIQDSQTVTIDSQNEEITVENEKIVQAVQLMKIDGETNETLADAVFELQRKVGNQYEKVAELTTDENGIIYQDELEAGDYQFIEIEAPNGYSINSEPIPFTIIQNQTEVTKITADNQIILGSVELTKVDQDDPNIVLSDAEYMLQDENGTVLEEGLTTNEEGKIVVNDLRPGKYQFVETKAPEYYELDVTPIKFEIVRGQKEPLQVTAYNAIQLGSVQLTKVDQDNHSLLLSDVEYQLQTTEGIVLQTGLTTDMDGKLIVDRLRPGQYQFVETKASFGYDLDPTPIEFTIEKGQTNPVLVTAFNELSTGSVQLIKVDQDDQSVVLEGAVFELQSTNGQKVQGEFKTDQDGKIVVHQLKPGTYQFVETKAPDGYELNQTPIKFTIELGQETIEIQVTNGKIQDKDGEKPPTDSNETNGPVKHSEETSLPDTATNFFNGLAIGLIFLLVGLILLNIRRRQKE
ncbi:SpaA isopeptide-forming pilin-related protein [Fervidibacillus halotolerans]|uniref:SpaA isopeptide-forming pilin-related protein n=1 Tax=Fervidibacillus halotolerans TaxID=2980027 RepID=A0A9E8RY53_9BACI|nr:collagen binding domain-containing protein [Fervidibacillus halotolerans]WAA11868.1 SpaA isopeptide-forming pilin-related protein [Fervidibacillus halotolerans]